MLQCDEEAGAVEHSVLAQKPFDIRPGQLVLWSAHLSGHLGNLPYLWALLSSEERGRMEKLVRASDKRNHALGRGLLRYLLGNYLDRDPATVKITTAPLGKPQVEWPIAFNLSHSEDRLLIGIAHGMEIGVDVQKIDPALPWHDFSANVFAPEEQAATLALTDAGAGRLAFFRCWTLKEALTKMDGDGLTRPFTSFSAPAKNDPCVRWGWIDSGPTFTAAWAARSADPVAVINRTIPLP